MSTPPASSLLSLACLTLLAGCASPPPIQAPEIDVELPAEWMASSAIDADPPRARRAIPPAASTTPDTTSTTRTWWQSFGDAGLDAIVIEVMERNHDLEVVAAVLAAADARARIAGADQLPTLDLGVTGSRSKQNFIGFPFGAPGGGVPSSLSTRYSLGLSTAWELDFWGRIRAGKVAALADRQAAEADLAAARLSLAGRATRAWFGATETWLQAQLAESSTASYRSTGDWVRERYDRGLRTSLELRLALANAASAAANEVLRRQQLDAARRQLEVLLGRYPSGAIALQESLSDIPPPIPAGLPSKLLLRRPDLIAAERRLTAADARHAEAWRAQFPRLSLTGTAGTSTAEFEELLNNDFSVWSILGNLVQPLFQGGRLRAGVRLAEAGVRQAAADYASQLLRAFSEVESALAAERFLADRERELALATEQSVAAQELAEDRYRSGLEAYVTVLAAQRSALQAQSQLLTVRRQRLDARVDLHMALGGGFDADLAFAGSPDAGPAIAGSPGGGPAIAGSPGGALPPAVASPDASPAHSPDCSSLAQGVDRHEVETQ